jgi:hypothetical protein
MSHEPDKEVNDEPSKDEDDGFGDFEGSKDVVKPPPPTTP